LKTVFLENILNLVIKPSFLAGQIIAY